MSRAAIPKGGNDRVYTPPSLAFAIVKHFRPRGAILEPCRGKGAFTDVMPEASWAEIDEGRDFFDLDGHWDWIVTNPPYSIMRRFLQHSMKLADNIVFLANINALMGTKARLRDIHEGDFGFVEVACVDTPALPWPQMGMQLAAIHMRRRHTGETKIRLDPIWTR